MYSFRYLGIILMFLAECSLAGEIYSEFRKQIHPNGKYVFYSHGLIVEGTNPRPVHPKFGTYEFSLIKDMLVKDSEFNLIAHHRPKNAKIEAYTTKLVSWVRTLVKAGVKPNNITLIGFSRGGQLTSFAANRLKDLKINTILLATCWPGSVQTDPTITFSGHFLSIYETTDGAKSCKQLSDRSEELLSFEEVAISTGKKHGAFFKPMKEWIVPVKKWINLKSN